MRYNQGVVLSNSTSATKQHIKTLVKPKSLLKLFLISHTVHKIVYFGKILIFAKNKFREITLPPPQHGGGTVLPPSS